MIYKKIKKIFPVEVKIPESGKDLEIYLAYLNKEDKWRQKAIDWAQTKLPKSIIIADGEVFFTRSSIRNALAHGKGKLKLLSIPYIPFMLQNGVFFYTERKNGFIFYNYAHPLKFEGENYYAIIVIREDSNGKRFYDNEFITKIADGLDYSQGLPDKRQKTCAHPSIGNILRIILNIK